jgi:hypothetical protein
MRWLWTAAAVVISVAASGQTSSSIDVPTGARTILEAHGTGVQIYRCTSANGVVQWTLEGPDAKLLDASGNQIGTHFAGPSWKLTDGSQVQGAMIASQPAAQSGAVPWLLLRAKPGTATGQLANVAYIRRTDTEGGAADPSGCRATEDAGKTARIPYQAQYTFYAAQ